MVNGISISSTFFKPSVSDMLPSVSDMLPTVSDMLLCQTRYLLCQTCYLLCQTWYLLCQTWYLLYQTCYLLCQTCCAVYLDKVYIESKIFPHNTIFSSWVVIKFWSVTAFPHASLHDLDESMSVLRFEGIIYYLLQTFTRRTSSIQNRFRQTETVFPEKFEMINFEKL
jgi:hypothetical protein